MGAGVCVYIFKYENDRDRRTDIVTKRNEEKEICLGAFLAYCKGIAQEVYRYKR